MLTIARKVNPRNCTRNTRSSRAEGLPPTIQKAATLSGLVDVLHSLDLVLRELALALLSTLAHLALEESLRVWWGKEETVNDGREE